MKLAVIETGGKQHLVKEGDQIEIEKLKENPSEIIFDKILLFSDEKNFLLGTPFLENVKVAADFIKEKKKKFLIIKYKPKTRYRRKKGYKKTTWVVKIKEIKVS